MAMMYTAYNILYHEDLKLTHDDLIFVALLAGGDCSVRISFTSSFRAHCM